MPAGRPRVSFDGGRRLRPAPSPPPPPRAYQEEQQLLLLAAQDRDGDPLSLFPSFFGLRLPQLDPICVGLLRMRKSSAFVQTLKSEDS